MSIKYTLFLFILLNAQIEAAQLSIEKSGNSYSKPAEHKKLIEQWLSAAGRGDLQTIEKLAPRIDVNARDEHNSTALIRAAWLGRGNVVKFLLQIPGIDVNARDPDTALIAAVGRGHENIVRILLRAPKIDVNVRTGHSAWTALSQAIILKRFELIEHLLQVPDIDVNISDNEGNTPLIHAAKLGREDMVKLLLQMPGININAKTENGDTALLQATWRCHHAVVKLIQEKIARLTIEAFQAISSYAKASDFAATSPKLQSASEGYAGLTTADAARNNLERLKSILEQIGIDTICDAEGNTLLDKAFIANKPEIIFLLLQNAKDPRELLARFPFENIQPSSDIFLLCIDMAYAKSNAKIEADSKTCANCSRAYCTKKCSRCKQVYYCSTECQKKHWRPHKHSCKTV